MTQRPPNAIEAEVAELWTETFGEQPAINADSQTMLRILVACLRDVGPWEFAPGATAAQSETPPGEQPTAGPVRSREPA